MGTFLKTWLFEEESFVPLALIQEGKAYSIVCDQLGTPTEAYDEEGGRSGIVTWI